MVGSVFMERWIYDFRRFSRHILRITLRAYPIMRRAQIAPSDFSSGEADFPQESFVDFKGQRRSMTDKIPASCVRIISG